MLGKLIKYDMKSLNRFLVVIHAALLLFSVIGRIFLTNRIDFRSEELNQTLLALSFTLFFMLFMTASFGTYIVIAIRFYKNLFSDEGYLSNTLPVTRGMHLLSKTITGWIWGIIDILCICLAIYVLIPTSVSEMFMANQSEFLSTFGFPGLSNFKFFIIYMIAASCVGVISSIIMIYASVAIGQLFSNHHILGAVVSYFAISTVISLLSTVVLAITGILADSMMSATQDAFNFYVYMNELMNITLVLSAVASIALYVATYLVMKKRLNLT